MENEKVNLLVSEDELLPEDNRDKNNNIEDDQYTEELDFSDLNATSSENQKEEKAEEYNLETPTFEIPIENENSNYFDGNVDVSVPLETSEFVSANGEQANEETVTSVPLEPVYEEDVMEHPSAKINLVKNEEEITKDKEIIESGELKKSLFENKALVYVFILGLILLIAIFVVPYFI